MQFAPGPARQPVYNAAKQWAALRGKPKYGDQNGIPGPAAPPSPPRSLSQRSNNWKSGHAPLASINPNAMLTGPMVSPYPQTPEQGPPQMAQNKLFPRPGQSPVQNRTYSGLLNGQRYGAQTLMDLKDDPEQGPLASQLLYGSARRAQAPMQGPAPYQNPNFARLMQGGGPGMAGAPYVGGGQQPMMPATTVRATPMQRLLQAPRPQDNPSDYDAFRQYNATGQQPTTTYSGSYAEQTSPSQKLLGARTPNELTARQDNRLGSTPTLAQAAADPNYNANGALFGGAKLGVNPQGQAFFREGPRPTDFAGNAQNQQQADANRARGLAALEARGVGYVDPATGAFFGRGARAFPSDGTGVAAIRGRLDAGGVTPSTLTPDQLDTNRLATIQRLADKRQSAMSRVQQMAEQRTADRRARMMGPTPLDRLLQSNPAAALAFQAQQNQLAGAERLAQLQNQNRLDVANIEAGGQQQRNQIGGLAALIGAGVPLNDARAQLGLPPIAGQQAPNAVPRFQPGSFAGANKQTFDYLKETLKDLDDENALSLMDEMGVPAELRAGLLDRAKPNWWRTFNKAAEGRPKVGTGGVGGVGPQIPSWPGF